MNLPTLLILLVICALAAFAVRTIRKKKLLSTCGGDCSRCAAGCKHRKENKRSADRSRDQRFYIA